MSETKNTADIIIVIDESGSMSSMGPEPVQAMNAFITEQKRNAGDSKLSLYTFNDNVRRIYNEIPLMTASTYSDYKPDRMTALYDAIGTAISNKVKEGRYENTVLVIITDGQDNSSKEYTAITIKKRIKHMEDVHNWQVLYLAADQDAFAVGGSYGVKGAKCANFSKQRGGMLEAMRQTSAACTVYRASSQVNDRPEELNLHSSSRTTSAPNVTYYD
jgi:hypothetical protein